MKLYAKKELKAYMIEHEFSQRNMSQTLKMSTWHINQVVNRVRATSAHTANMMLKYMMLNLNRFDEFFEWR